MRALLPVLAVGALLAACGGGGRAVSPSPTPSREPASLPMLPWEPHVLSGLHGQGIAVTLVGGSKFESVLGPRLPARVFITQPGSEGADVLALDRSIGQINVCTSYDGRLWSYEISVDGRTVSRGQGTQHVLFSLSPDFFAQAIGERFDAALRQTLATFPATCPPLASASATTTGACPRTQSVDASGVATANGVIGIVGGTYASPQAVNDVFTMVRRGNAKTGDTVNVTFRQVGTSAPATWVAYGVAAQPAKTPWGDLAYRLGVKPIGFAMSCWRLLVDGSDTGIVLEIGP